MYSPEQIKAVRKKAGLTQAEAAALISYSKRAWQDWEQGRKPMRDVVMDFFLLKLALRDAVMDFFLLKLALRDAEQEELVRVEGQEEYEERLKTHEHHGEQQNENVTSEPDHAEV